MEASEFLKVRKVETTCVETFCERNGFGSIELKTLLEEFADTKKIHVFKPSKRAAQLRDILFEQFGIALTPEIKRRYRDCETIKFEMKTHEGEIYLFHGLVQDFMLSTSVIRLSGNSFNLQSF